MRVIFIILLMFCCGSSLANAPVLVGKLEMGRHADGLAISGNYAYVTNNINGTLEVINVKDPAKPFLAGGTKLSSGPNGYGSTKIAVSGDYIYVVGCSDEGFLEVINITKPKTPCFVKKLRVGHCVGGVVVSGNYIYLVDAGSDVKCKPGEGCFYKYNKGCGLKIIDITNPLKPLSVGSIELGGESRGLAIKGDYAYVVDTGTVHGARRTDGIYKDAGLKVVDIKDRRKPVLVGNLKMYQLVGVTIVDNYAYVMSVFDDKEGGLKVIDIANPRAPFLVGNLTLDDYFHIEIVGDYAYLTGIKNELKIVNISNPAKPRLVGSLKTVGIVGGIAASKNHVYFTDRSGLNILVFKSSLKVVGS